MIDSVFEKIQQKNVIVFDGECVLCSAFFRFVVSIDKRKAFHFMLAQSEPGEILYKHYNLKGSDYDTNLVLINGQLFEKLYGLFEVLRIVGFPWSVLRIFRILPVAWLDWVYNLIARNRYRWFGRLDSCMVPNKDLLSKFID